MRPTFTAIEQVTLETPYGTVRLLFLSLQRCMVLLPDEHTEPPTAYMEIDRVKVEGRLVFDHFGSVWELDRDPEQSHCYDVECGYRVSNELRDKLARKLSVCLEKWVNTNPDAMQSIDQALQRQAIEKLEAEIDELQAEIDVLVAQKRNRQAVMCVLQARLNEDTAP